MADNAFPSNVSGVSGKAGLTKRELIAAMALQGLASAFYSPGATASGAVTLTDAKLAKDAVKLADALLTELG